MSKITKDNLSDRLKDELVTDAEMLNVTGNKANLTTTDKANLVAAINELKIDFDTLRVQYEELKKVVNEGSKVVECVSIELDVENLEFTEIGKGQEIKATILPSGCTEQLVWHSSNEAVATVTNGVVVTTGVGNCTISAICGSKIDTCNVKVEEPSTSKYLLKDGKFKTTTEFGEGVFNSISFAIPGAIFIKFSVVFFSGYLITISKSLFNVFPIRTPFISSFIRSLPLIAKSFNVQHAFVLIASSICLRRMLMFSSPFCTSGIFACATLSHS
jgi:hypothetical protein